MCHNDTCRQKAPSAKRCIKTEVTSSSDSQLSPVRKHRAPKGALRLSFDHLTRVGYYRRQKAPSAKRCIKTLSRSALRSPRPPGQKAPSAKRCIKTRALASRIATVTNVRKHRAPKGALRPPRSGVCWGRSSASESTERQKVH